MAQVAPKDTPKAMGAHWRERLSRLLVAGALAGGIACGIAGCASNTAARTPTPNPSATARASASPDATASPTAGAAPTITPQGTAPAEAGAGDICDQPANVSAQPPSSLPAYPGAQLHISFINNGNGLFGYCSHAQVSDIAQFYTSQLPGQGWGSVDNHTLQTYRQVTASAGSTQLTITISPDNSQSGVTDILITAQGLS